jgi:hypothetical protein
MSVRVRDLTVKCGLDWGGSGPSSKPGCVVFGVALPDQRAHIFDELKIMRLPIADAAVLIRDKCLKDWALGKMPPIYCDPALKIKTGQIGEDYIQTFARHKVVLTPVSNAREAGWQRVHEALSAMPGGTQPWLTIHPRCRYLIRTLPAMVADDHNAEDLDTNSDDHACDALRYLMMGGLRQGSKAVLRTPAREGSWAWMKRHYRERVA